MVLLYSVGTFLYVGAIHIFPEVFPRLDKVTPEEKKKHFPRAVQISVLIAGLFTPGLLYLMPDV